MPQSNDRGVQFALQSEEKAFLSVSAEDNGSATELKVLQSLPGPDHRYYSLLSLLSNTLVDSVKSEVTMLALNSQEPDELHSKETRGRDVNAEVGPFEISGRINPHNRAAVDAGNTKPHRAEQLAEGLSNEPPPDVGVMEYEPTSSAGDHQIPVPDTTQFDGNNIVGTSLHNDAHKAAPAHKIFEIPVDSTDELQEALNTVSRIPMASGTRNGGVPRPAMPMDPAVAKKAVDIGLKLEAFENRGIEEQAAKELNALLRNSRSEGFLSVIREYGVNSSQVGRLLGDNVLEPLGELFEQGQRISELTVADILNRPTQGETLEQLRGPTPELAMHLPGPRGEAVASGEVVDIFQSPAELYGHAAAGMEGPVAADSSREMGSIPGSGGYNAHPAALPDPPGYSLDQQRLSTLLTELSRTPAEIHDSIIDSYRELLLSENMLYLLKCANATSVELQERKFYQKITEKTITLTAELGALVKSESVRHLETIHEVCEIAAQFQHDEDKFLERMQYVKPRFDTALLAYLSYAISEETLHIRQRGLDPDLAPSQWLQVLIIVQRGVSAEFEHRYQLLLEPLLLVVRFDDPELRSEIFRRFVSITPTMDLPYLKALALNMIDGVLQHEALQTPGDTGSRQAGNALAVADSVVGAHPAPGGRAVHAFSSAQPLTHRPLDPTLVPRMHALRTDVDTHLSDDYIRDKLRVFQEEAQRQGKKVVLRHRNPVVQAERETAEELELEHALRGGPQLPTESGGDDL
jgi:hypothetical protein